MAYIANVHDETTFRFRGIVDGQCCIAMLDTGATHNFINEYFVAWCKLQVEDFYGFRV